MESNWAERTIVVSGIPEGILSTSRMIDKLTIHFLRLRNGGGEVENIIYPVDATGMAYVTFEKGEVVESVLRQKEQVLEDKRLPVKYPLKISQYSEDVFMQVSVDLDLSMFGESLELKKLVREHQSNNKTLRFSNARNGTMHIEGSFSAIKELRKDLTRIAGELLVIEPQSSVSKSGISASERKLVKPASNDATQMTEPQKLAASPSYGANDVLHPGVFEEETTIILDADIFTYISMFCKEKFEAVLRKNDVRAKEIKCDDITVLQLQKASERCQPSQLMTTKFEIETLISQMQQSLVTEKIRLDGDRGQNKTLEICKETIQGFPEVWVRITDEYVTLVGNVNDCKQFRKEVEEKVKAGQSDPTFSGHSGIPNATGYSHQFGQSLGSNAADRLDVSNASKCSRNRNSHSDQYMMSQVDSCQTSCSRNDAHGKWGSSHCGGGPLINRQPSSLPISLSMSSSPIQDSQTENTARSERSKNNRHY